MRKLTERIKKGGVIRSAPLDLILAANGKPTGDQLREQLLRDERERRKEEILPRSRSRTRKPGTT